MFPANVVSTNKISEVIDRCFLISKPDKKEKGELNTHKTVKPVSLCEYIIKLTTYSEDAIVLDPFAGSGTTLVAAKKLGRKFIGIDINEEYIEIAKERIKNTGKNYSVTEKLNSAIQMQIFESKVEYKRKHLKKLQRT